MLILFIRHGETVDNVAGVYAGVKDSELTNHGILQARQLGEYLKKSRPPVRRILASPLQRARRTAEAIRNAQIGKGQSGENRGVTGAEDASPILSTTPLLIEQDFGFYEGKSFFARSADGQRSGKAAHQELHKNDPGFKDIESAESMAERCDKFLDDWLFPVVDEAKAETESSIAIVSHGILLSQLWRRFLLRLPRRSITIAPEVTATKGRIVLEHPGGWSNTGFLEVRLSKNDAAPLTASEHPNEPYPTARDTGTCDEGQDLSRSGEPGGDIVRNAGPELEAGVDGSPSAPVPEPASRARRTAPVTEKLAHRLLAEYKITIITINGQEHLKGLKRARGGIGSAKYDEGQKSLESFFKRAKKP